MIKKRKKTKKKTILRKSMQKEFSHTVKIKPHPVVLVFHVCSSNIFLRLTIPNHARNRGKEIETWEF